MSEIQVRAFNGNHVAPAAELLAARQRRDRLVVGALSPALEQADVCEAMVATLHANSRGDGVVAEQDGRLVGLMFGERMTFAPTEFPSMFILPHSISIPVQGHAVAQGTPAFPVYRAMYTELAALWVRQGFFDHQTHIFAADAELQEAWVALGFGRTTTAAIRPTIEPVAGAQSSQGREVRRAAEEDLEVVMALGDTLFRFHSLSPIFWPFLGEPQPAARAYQRGMLSDPANGYFVAYDQERPVAMQTYVVQGFQPPIVPLEGNVYLFEGVVEPDVRGGGLGTQLLAHGLAWAKEQGHDFCTLHFASANPSGGPFWLGHGFVPVEYTMVRHVDERVAWAS